MSKKKFDDTRPVTHGELRALVAHLSAKFTAIEARLDECERVRPVDPAVKAAADDLVDSVRKQSGMDRLLTLVTEDSVKPDAGHTAGSESVDDL